MVEDSGFPVPLVVVLNDIANQRWWKYLLGHFPIGVQYAGILNPGLRFDSSGLRDIVGVENGSGNAGSVTAIANVIGDIGRRGGRKETMGCFLIDGRFKEKVFLLDAAVDDANDWRVLRWRSNR